MGIVNVTPDSFYDGGKYNDPLSALNKALLHIEEGADIIDIGAESTRPGAMPVDSKQESKRLFPALELILSRKPDAAISVDTRSAHTASMALDAGAAVINDISACRHDPAMLDVIVHYKPGYILMHAGGEPRTMQSDPQYDDIVTEIASFFETRLNYLVSAGVPEDRIILDPGIGFGKTVQHNMALLEAADTFAQFGRPLLVGISNKSFLGSLLGLQLHERQEATLKFTLSLAGRGYQWHRLHHIGSAALALEHAGLISRHKIAHLLPKQSGEASQA